MNWKLRLQSYPFWMALISLAGMVVVTFVPEFDFGPVKEILYAVLSLMVTMGIVTDPTTPGVGDSSVSLDKKDINQTAEDIIKKEGK